MKKFGEQCRNAAIDREAICRYIAFMAQRTKSCRALRFRLGLLLAVVCALLRAAAADRSEPNILLITVDTLRQDRVGVYSRTPSLTPAIDALAAHSLVFLRAFSHNPVTLAAHTNILTGTTPLFHGISDNPGFRLDERFLTLAKYLKAKGYATAAFVGAYPLDSRFGLNQGFDLYDDYYGNQSPGPLYFVERQAEKVIAPAIAWLSRQSGKWFAWVHLFDPHEPYAPPPPYDQKYASFPYDGEVAYTDAQLAVLFRFLEERGLAGRTAIVFTADHGEAFGEKGETSHSYFAYNNTILVPLILHVPGIKPARVAENVCHIDIFPTLCKLLGDKPPAHLQGESLLPLAAGKKRKEERIYFESLTPYLSRGWAPLRGFIRGDLKYIDQPIPEVYDLAQDPGENDNRAERSDIPRLKAELFRLMASLKGERPVQRFSRIDSEEQRKLRSLGYIAGPGPEKKVFSRDDDLKVLKPIQNKMVEAVAKYRRGQRQEAIADLEEVIARKPTFTMAIMDLTAIYQEVGAADRALDLLRRGLEKNPDNVRLMSRLGILLIERNAIDEGMGWLQRGLKLEADDVDTLNYLGVGFTRLNRVSDALDCFRRALAIAPDDALVHSNLATLHLGIYLKERSEEEYRLARESYDRALALDPRLVPALNGRATARRCKGDLEGAIADWQQLVAVQPGALEARLNLGSTFLEKGDKQAAFKVLTDLKEKFANRLSAAQREKLERLLDRTR